MLVATSTILNIAHRGARAYAPENTLVAFAKAKDFGCQMFEMDVRMSKDGEIVVHHDENLFRCTDAAKKFPRRVNNNLADFTCQELQTLDAGSWYLEQLAMANEQRQWYLQSLTDVEVNQYISAADRKYYASGEVKIPTLNQTLALAKALELMVNIELKSPVADPDAFVNGVLTAIKHAALDKQVLVSSFDHDLLRILRQRSKKIATAALTDLPLKAPVTYLRKLKATAYNLGFDRAYETHSVLPPQNNRYLQHIAKMRKSAFAVNIWTCNDPKEMRYLLAAGVTGLISDYPNRVRNEVADFLRAKEIAKTDLSTA